MGPVLRIVIPSASLTETLRELGGEAHSIIIRGDNVDYITDDPSGNKPIPVGALYAARMNDRGQVTRARAKHASLDPDHTYLGWPVPE